MEANNWKFLQSIKTCRFYVSAFNIDEELLSAFTLPKGRSEGSGAVFEIKYMDATIHVTAYAAEFFIEFSTAVWQHKLAERLEELGAGSLHFDTFPSNDANNAAAGCLVRLWNESTKPDHRTYKRGVCTHVLMERALTKQQSERQQQAEFDEKTGRAINASVERLGEKIDANLMHTTAGFTTVVDGVGKATIEINQLRCTIDNWDLLIHKVGRMQSDVDRLQGEIKHKTLLADRVEHSKGLVTQKLNESLTESARLERELEASRATVEANARTITALTVRLTEERLTASVLREHVAACTVWMRKRARAVDTDDDAV